MITGNYHAQAAKAEGDTIQTLYFWQGKTYDAEMRPID
jgi:hypothetical protein